MISIQIYMIQNKMFIINHKARNLGKTHELIKILVHEMHQDQTVALFGYEMEHSIAKYAAMFEKIGCKIKYTPILSPKPQYSIHDYYNDMHDIEQEPQKITGYNITLDHA